MIQIHTVPEQETLYQDISVLLNGSPVRLYSTRVSAMPFNREWPGHQRPLSQTELAPVLSFESDEEVTLTLIYPHPVREVLVRPLSRGVKATSDDGFTYTLTLKEVGAYTVEADGFHHALHVFNNPVNDFSGENAKTILRYTPGVHHIGHQRLLSDTTVIIEAGAFVYGSFTAVNAENVRICGYGVLDGSEEVRDDESYLLPSSYYSPVPSETDAFWEFITKKHVLNGLIRFYFCKNISVEGVTMRDCATFALIPANCEHGDFGWIKTIGMWRYNSDGIDIVNSEYINIHHSFFRDFDDCIVIKGVCGFDSRPNQHITVSSCVTWCDWGRNLEIGAETNAPYYDDILFTDCDCIHSASVHMDIHHHNRADIRNVSFINVRAEYSKYQLNSTLETPECSEYPKQETTYHPSLIEIPIWNMGLFSRDGLHGSAHDVLFDNIQVLTDDESIPMPRIMLQGLSETQNVYNVTIHPISFNGKTVTDRNDANIEERKFASCFYGE